MRNLPVLVLQGLWNHWCETGKFAKLKENFYNSNFYLYILVIWHICISIFRYAYLCYIYYFGALMEGEKREAKDVSDTEN